MCKLAQMVGRYEVGIQVKRDIFGNAFARDVSRGLCSLASVVQFQSVPTLLTWRNRF
uniref:Uncharacterized protein n=1 Tax=Salix viminalis TaxID=40686 RepID=A0A6N2MWA9_SALVM